MAFAGVVCKGLAKDTLAHIPQPLDSKVAGNPVDESV